MNGSAIALPARRPGAVTPAWAAFSMAAVGVAIATAVSAGGMWPVTTLVFLFLGVAFVLVLKRPHVGISIFLTTFLVNYPAVARGAGVVTINNLLGAQFLVLLAWTYYRERDAWFLRDPLVRLLLMIGAIFIIGTVAAEFTLPDGHIQRLVMRTGNANVRGDYTERFVFQYFSRLAFLIFILRFVETPRQLRGVFLVLLACTLVAVPPALNAVRTGGSEARALTRLVSWADNANRFAFGMLLGASLFYHLGATLRGWPLKLAAGLGVATLVPVALLSASRSGFLGLFLLGFLVFMGTFGGERRRGRRSALVVLMIMAISAGLTYSFLLSPALQERLLNLNPFAEQGEGSASSEFRTATLANSLEIIEEHPIFGVGLGNFRWYHKLKQGRFKPPHNSYVWALAEGGVPLLLAYLTFFVALWRRLGRIRADWAGPSALPYFPDWLRVYLIMLLFFSVFADVWLEEHIFLLTGATILLDRWRVAATAPAPAPAPETHEHSGTLPQLVPARA